MTPEKGGAGRLVSAGNDVPTRVWDLNTPEAEPLELHGPVDVGESSIFAPHGAEAWRLAAVSRGIRVWNLDTLRTEPRILGSNEDWVHAMAFDPWGSGRLATREADGSVRVWNLNDLQATPLVLDTHQASNSDMVFDPRGGKTGRLATVNDGTVRVWDLSNPTSEPLVLPGHLGSTWYMDFDPQGVGAGRLAVVGDKDRTIRVWNLNDPKAKPLALIDPDLDVDFSTVAFDPYATGAGRLVTGGNRGALNVWELNFPMAKSRVLMRNTYPGYRVVSVVFTPRTSGAKQLISSGRGGTRMWDLDSPEAIYRPLIDHRRSVEFDPQWTGAGRLATRGDSLANGVWDDNSARVWDLNHPTANPVVLRGSGMLLAFDHRKKGGGELAAVGYDGKVRVWTFDRATLQDLGCRYAPRNLSRDEWKKYFDEDDLHLTCPNRPIGKGFLDKAKYLASNGEIEQAISEFTAVFERFGTDAFDPSWFAGRYAAPGEVERGDNLARSGKPVDIVKAVDHYRRALKLDPSWRIVPTVRAAEIASWTRVKEGDYLARQGNISTAVATYEQALGLYPSRHINPRVRAWQLAAPARIRMGDE